MSSVVYSVVYTYRRRSVPQRLISLHQLSIHRTSLQLIYARVPIILASVMQILSGQFSLPASAFPAVLSLRIIILCMYVVCVERIKLASASSHLNVPYKIQLDMGKFC